MATAIRIHEPGGTNKLTLEQIEVGPPAANEVKLHHHAIGLNFIDVYMRNGLYPVPSYPAILGVEAAGEVIEIGDKVSGFFVGDKVAYVCPTPGAYCTERNIKTKFLIKLPDSINTTQAAGAMVKGMTAQFLLKQIGHLNPGDRVLIHAAAGGVGSILCQWARHMKLEIIATAGSEAKINRIKSLGCDHSINYQQVDFVEQVNQITNGQGVKMVFDSVGKQTLERSIQCLGVFGRLVSFGQSSGKPKPIDVLALGAKSAGIIRPSLFHFIAERDRLEAMASDLFEVIASGAVKIEIGQSYPLDQVKQAHHSLESRATSASTILIP